MGLLEDLQARSENQCELCAATANIKIYDVKPVSTGGVDGSLLACETCIDQIENPDNTDSNHWRCLNDSMWSEHRAVQAVAWRMLSRLKKEGWPKEFQVLCHNCNNVKQTHPQYFKQIGEQQKEFARQYKKTITALYGKFPDLGTW